MRTQLPILLLTSALCTLKATAQSQAYQTLIKQAEAAYNSADYHSSTKYYSQAFATESGKSTADDRYNAACSWALINRPDSAFYNLFAIVQLADWSNYTHLRSDVDLISLHHYKAWQELCRQVKANARHHDPATDTALADELREIAVFDQMFRLQEDWRVRTYGAKSPQVIALRDSTRKYDALNLSTIVSLLEKRGWIPKSEIGRDGISTVFIVLQHADSATQQRFLPMLQNAAKRGQLPGADLALYEDRVNLNQGKKQVYGSQIMCDDRRCKVLPLEDPLNVDQRRKAVGLKPISDYVKKWDITWNATEYAKQQAADKN